MRVLICGSSISGHMASCWKQIVDYKYINIRILCFDPRALNQNSPYCTERLIGELQCEVLTGEERVDNGVISSIVREFRPDVVVIAGWFYRPYTRLVRDRSLAHAKFIMIMDTPLNFSWRQRLARLKIGGLLNRVDRVWVPGERGWLLARYWNIPESKIRKGMLAIDYESASQAYEARRTDGAGWPRRFLFCGRYIDVKGIDILIESYTMYRAMVADPWPLDCCGTGPLAPLLRATEGIRDLGFIQPVNLPEVWARVGAFVLLSRQEPWGAVIAEACAAGLPVLCSQACGAAVELVQSYFNGLTVATGDSRTAAAALRWLHEHHRQLPEMGTRSRHLAAAYSAEMWARRFTGILDELHNV